MAKVWIPLAVGAAALTGMFFVFMNGASPYVTVAEAKTTSGDRLHLKGAIVDGTLDARPREGKVYFQLKDEKGDSCQVIYNGPPPSNMGEAKEVVQGSACRTGGTDDWTVKDVKPFRQS